MHKRLYTLSTLLIVCLLLFTTGVALAQAYYTEVPQVIVDVYWNADGTSSIDYLITFANTANGAPLDYVDIGIPNPNYDMNSIYADVDGQEVTDITTSPYVNPGVAVGLGPYTIQPGDTGELRVYIARVNDVLYPDDQDENYVSAVFDTTFIDSDFVTGSTDMTVAFHLPPGVTTEEPRWHSAPSGFPSEPETYLDNDGRVVYSWNNPNANFTQPFKFGASFPKTYVPSGVIQAQPSLFDRIGISGDDLVGFGCCAGIALLIGGFTALGVISGNKRKLQYLPPRVSIEGHGIKRGLTAVESAILLEQPLDKILTMILFGAIKKDAATVKTRDPLELDVASPLPDGLYDYEKDFLRAFEQTTKSARRKELQDAMTALIKSVALKMKGFSHKETVAYYKDIVERAWKQVETAETPEVKSAKYDEVMEWTMMDKDYDDRTRRTFSGGPVFIPTWWGHYDPTFSPGSSGPQTVSTGGGGSSSSGGGGGINLPTLPGSDFAASVVGGVQNFAGGVVGNVQDFTSTITNRTNPPPPPPPRSSGGSRSGGGGGCACACACAGCACACAGGGR